MPWPQQAQQVFSVPQRAWHTGTRRVRASRAWQREAVLRAVGTPEEPGPLRPDASAARWPSPPRGRSSVSPAWLRPRGHSCVHKQSNGHRLAHGPALCRQETGETPAWGCGLLGRPPVKQTGHLLLGVTVGPPEGLGKDVLQTVVRAGATGTRESARSSARWQHSPGGEPPARRPGQPRPALLRD